MSPSVTSRHMRALNSRFNFVEMEIYHEHSRVLVFSFSKLVSGPFHISTSRSAAFLKWCHRMSLYDCDFFFFFKPVPRAQAGACSPVCWDKQGCDGLHLCPGCGLKWCSCSAKTSFALQVCGWRGGDFPSGAMSGCQTHYGSWDQMAPSSDSSAPTQAPPQGCLLLLLPCYTQRSVEMAKSGTPLPRTAPYHHP